MAAATRKKKKKTTTTTTTTRILMQHQHHSSSPYFSLFSLWEVCPLSLPPRPVAAAVAEPSEERRNTREDPNATANADEREREWDMKVVRVKIDETDPLQTQSKP
jgi:hypothetical protein